MSPLLILVTMSRRSSTPSGILKIAEGPSGDRSDRDFPGAFLDRLVVEHEMELRARREREITPVVVGGLEVVIVDRDHEVPFLDLQEVAVGGPVLVDVSDF